MLTLYNGKGESSTYDVNKKKPKAPWKKIIHRGGFDGYPENTIASFFKCWEAGMDGCEIDTQVTTDNVIIVVHDATITGVSATTGETVTITPQECTLAEVKDIILASTDDFGDIYVPTLDEALAFFRYHNMYVFDDQKNYGSMERTAFHVEVAKKVVLHNMSELFNYWSDTASEEAIKAVDPTGGISTTSIYGSSVTEDAVLAIRASGKKVFTGGGNSESLTMPYYPDFIMFNNVEQANLYTETYMDSLRFFDNALAK